MKVRRATLGLAAIDFVGIVARFAVIGDERQVAPQTPTAVFAQPAVGQASVQALVETFFEFVDWRQPRDQSLTNGVVAGRLRQTLASVEDRSDPRRRVEQDMPKQSGPTFATAIFEADGILKNRAGTFLDILRGDGILCGSHSSLHG